MHADIQIIFYMYIDHIKNADNWVAAILDMQISKCNVISGYALFMKYRNHIILQKKVKKVTNKQNSPKRFKITSYLMFTFSIKRMFFESK